MHENICNYRALREPFDVGQMAPNVHVLTYIYYVEVKYRAHLLPVKVNYPPTIIVKGILHQMFMTM